MKSKSVLSDEVRNVIRQYNNQRNVLKRVEGFFSHRNVGAGEILPYWNGNRDLSELSDLYLLLFSYELHAITGEVKLDPHEYFTATEIQEGLKWKKKDTHIPVELPLAIQNVIAVTDSQWITVINIQTLKNWYYDLPIVYNFNTQRHAKIKRVDNSIIKVKNTNTKSIATITDRLIHKKQFPDMLTLNILSDGNDRIAYDEKRRVLTILSGEIDDLDGDHRISGILGYLDKYPEANMLYELRIVNFDEETARNFQDQIQTVNKFSSAQKEALQIEKASNRCVKRIMSGQSDFGRMITENAGYVFVGESLVTFIVVNQALRYIFGLTNNKQILNREINRIADWVSTVLDEIIGLYPREFIQREFAKTENNLMIHENMFIGYIALAKKLEGNRAWRQALESAMDSIDFSSRNIAWQELRITAPRSSVNKRYVEKIADYFAEQVRC